MHGAAGEIGDFVGNLHPRGVATLVSGVGAGDGESARQSRIATGCRSPDGGLHRTIQATASLKQEPTVPVFRKRKGEANAVGRTRGAGTPIDHAIEATVRRQRRRRRCRAGPARGRRPRRHPLRVRDRQRDARHLQLLQRGACDRRRRNC